MLSKPSQSFRVPFLISCGLGVIFMQPWLIGSWQNAGMMVVFLVMLALWVTAGCLIGAMLGMLIVAIGAKAKRYLKS